MARSLSEPASSPSARTPARVLREQLASSPSERYPLAEMNGDPDMRLMDAIRRGDVPTPPLCDYSKGDVTWLRWRASYGRRPFAVKDGYHTTPGLESHLWRTAMFETYGDAWEADLKAQRATAKTGAPPVIRGGGGGSLAAVSSASLAPDTAAAEPPRRRSGSYSGADAVHS